MVFDFIKDLKQKLRKAGIYETIAAEYEAICNTEDRIDFNEYLIQIHVNHLLFNKPLPWSKIKPYFPKEWHYVVDKFKHNKLLCAINAALEHNKKIDSIRQNLNWESLQDYSNSVLPLRSGKLRISVQTAP